VTEKSRVVTFRLDQATWDWMRELVPYTKYRNTSSLIREGIELLLKQEEEQPSGWSVGAASHVAARRVLRARHLLAQRRRQAELASNP
jgi:Arc/MetJ-type ribon-helix-helix transcriptional regulator